MWGFLEHISFYYISDIRGITEATTMAGVLASRPHLCPSDLRSQRVHWNHRLQGTVALHRAVGEALIAKVLYVLPGFP